jgi:hypothetical protein
MKIAPRGYSQKQSNNRRDLSDGLYGTLVIPQSISKFKFKKSAKS